MSAQKYQSVTLHKRDVQELEEYAENQMGTSDVSYRTMVRVLLENARGGDA
jgi:hypothetical protein